MMAHCIDKPQASNFNTDVVNRMGFSNFFMDKSDKMWARGKVQLGSSRNSRKTTAYIFWI